MDGTEKAPECSTDQAMKTAFTSRYRKAFSVIPLSVSTELLYLLTDTEAPDVELKRLPNHSERNTLGNKLFLKKQYFSTVMKEGTPLEQHLKNMKGLSDKLAAIDAPISEEDQVVTLLGSLPNSYAHLATALEARVNNLSLEFAQQSLINEELKGNERNSNESTSASASDSALVSRKRTRSRKPIICYNCNNVGTSHQDAQRTDGDRTRIRAAAKKGYIVQFGHTRCWIKDSRGRVRAMGSPANKLFSLDCVQTETRYANTASTEIWHHRLVHVNDSNLKKLNKGNIVCATSLPAMNISFCEDCAEGKMTREPFQPVGDIKATRKIELVHSEVCPMETESNGDQLRQKIDKKCQKLRFIRYRKQSKAYRLLDELTGKVTTRRDGVFDETNFTNTVKPSCDQ
ncbi:uncharacterized protein [Watersipora subatra]|uniref:uncharacterized protein n=1 Tax=Watersipora subatra TaxID=2589382 RepID=UPI00355AE3C1